MDELQDRSPLSMRAYLKVLWRRRWIIVLAAVVALGASIAYDVAATPIYEATAELQLTPQISSALLQANNSSVNSTANVVDVPTDIQILESNSVAAAVKKKMPDAPSVSVSQVGLTNVVSVVVRSPNAKVAAAAANAYASSYIQVQQLQAVAALNNAEQIIQSHITDVQNQINALQQQLNNSSTKEQPVLQTQLSSLQTQLASYQSQMAQYQFAASLNTGGGQVVSTASVPTKPADPKPISTGILALFAGIVVGIIVALLVEYYDESIRTKDDLERVVSGIPILGLIPSVGDWRSTKEAFLVSRTAPGYPPSEAYRSLRTSIQFLGLDRSVRTLQFTSPNAAEGKTTTLANMATTMAQAGQKVVVVCCDLRRPRIHEFFNLSNTIGFTSVLLEDAKVEDALQSAPGIPGLSVLASGPKPPNPSELLSGRRAQRVFEQLQSCADIILIDSPPVLPVTDASVLATQVDGVLLVASVGVSSRRDVTRAIEVLGRVDAPVLGAVLNRASEDDSYAYYQYSDYLSDIDTKQNGRQGMPRHSSGRRSSRLTT